MYHCSFPSPRTLQEHLQSLAQESLQADRDRLEREARRLQRESDDWKVVIVVSVTLAQFGER